MKRIVFVFACLLLFMPFVYAQEEVENVFPNSDELSQEVIQNKDRNTVTDIPESTIIEDKYAGKYVKSSVENISRLYWLKGALDYKNDKAIDNFVLINECDFYLKNINDDFKWIEIRKATRNYLKENVSTFTDKFKIIVPIDLGRYDTEKKGFPLIGGTAIRNLRRVEIGGNSSEVCGESLEIEYYPKNLHLVLNRPFTYDFLSIDEHLAQAFIVKRNVAGVVRPKEIRSETYNRLAFARIRMQFMDYQLSKKERYERAVSVMFGKVDGIDVFEHADETGLLATIDY